LEPKFRILTALCRLVLVQHEDEETGRLLLRYCGAKNCLVSLIKTAITMEVKSTASFEVLFREESIATKLMSSLFFSQWGGNLYLLKVVQPIVDSITKSIFATEEIDLANDDHVNLISTFAEDFLSTIYSSSSLFPM
jgi:hypothetical protein